ncbi:hypothetical protein AB0K60_08915 [Thermopolyspora sp. NPDC052614]
MRERPRASSGRRVLRGLLDLGRPADDLAAAVVGSPARLLLGDA